MFTTFAKLLAKLLVKEFLPLLEAELKKLEQELGA
jgi:hypothetical protein